MRIVRGHLRGKRIQPPKNLRARPTTDFAKESLFNILHNQIDFEDQQVLDLFCGSGSIAYEFVSNGVEEVWAVDMDKQALRFVTTFCEKNAIDNIKMIHANVYSFLKTVNKKFDIIFADPPYKHKHVHNLHEKIINANVLNPDGLLIIEHGPETVYSDSPYFTGTRKYGNVNFSFFKQMS